jgi:hypothetical protein
MTHKERGTKQEHGPLSNVTFREPRRGNTTRNAQLMDSDEYSSFLEIIECDANGQEKVKPTPGPSLVNTLSEAQYSSFLEIIEYDENGLEKVKPTSDPSLVNTLSEAQYKVGELALIFCFQTKRVKTRKKKTFFAFFVLKTKCQTVHLLRSLNMTRMVWKRLSQRQSRL